MIRVITHVCAGCSFHHRGVKHTSVACYAAHAPAMRRYMTVFACRCWMDPLMLIWADSSLGPTWLVLTFGGDPNYGLGTLTLGQRALRTCEELRGIRNMGRPSSKWGAILILSSQSISKLNNSKCFNQIQGFWKTPWKSIRDWCALKWEMQNWKILFECAWTLESKRLQRHQRWRVTAQRVLCCWCNQRCFIIKDHLLK